MKTTKYILSALCLAALAAGCTKDTGMRNATSTPSVEGLRISASTAAPSTRTALHEDGLTVLWEEGDQLQLIPAGGDNDNVYMLTLDKSSLSSDGTQADFVASEAIPEGEYYLASSNAKPNLQNDPTTIAFLYSDSKDVITSNITVTDATRNTHEGGLKVMALLSDKFTVSADASEISTQLKHYSALLELPILLTSNTYAEQVKLNKISLETSSSVFLDRIQCGFGSSTSGSTSLSITFSDTPALPVGEPYKVYMPLLAMGSLDLSAGEVTITVSTSVGDFAFTKQGRAFQSGYRYTLSDLNIAAQPTLITNETEWNQALAEGKTPLTLGADVELTASATLPTYDVTVKGDYTLTMNAEGRTPSASSSSMLYVPTTNGHAVIASKLTLTDGANLTVKNGYLYISELEIGNGSELSGEGGRLVVTSALTVASGASAAIASGLVASCKSLYREGATLTVNGKLYYGNIASGEAPSGDVAQVSNVQLPYSNFDNWFTKRVTAFWIANGTADLIGEESSGQNIWGNGNGNESGSGGTAAIGANPTTPETTHIASIYGNQKACKMFSTFISSTFAKKFAAGNLFLGTFNTATTSGAQMTFGISSEGRLPIAVTGYYDYRAGTIDYVGGSNQAGGTDSMDLYIALATKQYSVDTTDDTSYPGGSTSDLANDPNIVAYGRLTSSETTSDYRPFYIELTYKDNNFTPSGDLYLLITATSSKDGAQFTGSTSSVLYLDELSLEF